MVSDPARGAGCISMTITIRATKFPTPRGARVASSCGNHRRFPTPRGARFASRAFQRVECASVSDPARGAGCNDRPWFPTPRGVGLRQRWPFPTPGARVELRCLPCFRPREGRGLHQDQLLIITIKFPTPRGARVASKVDKNGARAFPTPRGARVASFPKTRATSGLHRGQCFRPREGRGLHLPASDHRNRFRPREGRGLHQDTVELSAAASFRPREGRGLHRNSAHRDRKTFPTPRGARVASIKVRLHV